MPFPNVVHFDYVLRSRSEWLWNIQPHDQVSLGLLVARLVALAVTTALVLLISRQR
jgi:hypothetical protein